MSKYIGDVSAYAYAVSKGYTGTEEEFAELMASYADVGQTAVDAKDAAVAAKTAAQTAATTATNKASEVTTAAQTATTKAGEAAQSASQAQTSATAASTKASEASQSASTASAKATEATTAAGTATTAKVDAVTAKNAAETAQAAAEDAAESVSASAAQIDTNTADISDIKEDLNIIVDGHDGGENLFDPSIAVEGLALISNGSTTSSSNKFVSDYIPVTGDYDYIYKGGTPNIVFIASYDASKTFIDGSFETGVSEYTTPSGAKYVRITDYIVYKTVAVFSAVPTKGLRESIAELEDTLDVGAVSDGYPLVSSASYTALIMGNGEITSTTNTLFVVRKYAVEKNNVYAIKGTQVNVKYDAYGLAAFSESNYTGTKINSELIIYGSGATSTNYNVTFTAPADGYIYLLLYDVNKPKLELYDAVLLSRLMYKLTNANKDIVKIQAFGDSITDDSWRADNTTWLTLLPDYLTQRTLSIKNEGVGGSHIGHGRVNSDTGKYHDLEYNYVYDLMTNADIFDPTSDIIVMFVGTNDFNSSPLGQWGDSTVDTFYGAAKMVCEYISQNTSALFLVVTPIARPDDADTSKQLDANGERINGYGATLRDYADALIRTCEFYQFPVIDLFHDIGWNKTNVKPYLDTTGVHPSVKGSNVICAYISSEIKKHLGI